MFKKLVCQWVKWSKTLHAHCTADSGFKFYFRFRILTEEF